MDTGKLVENRKRAWKSHVRPLLTNYNLKRRPWISEWTAIICPNLNGSQFCWFAPGVTEKLVKLQRNFVWDQSQFFSFPGSFCYMGTAFILQLKTAKKSNILCFIYFDMQVLWLNKKPLPLATMFVTAFKYKYCTNSSITFVLSSL